MAEKLILNHRQVVSLIKAMGQKRTVIVEGEAGSGKTTIHYELGKDPFYAQYHFVKPIDCTQLSEGSVWMPDIDRDRGVSCELPNERFGVSKDNRLGIDGSRPVMVCFDEVAKAKQYIKDAIAPILYERRLGEYGMPEGSLVCGFTNLSTEGLGDNMQAHLRDRIIFVTLRKPTMEEWVNEFAIPAKLHESIIGGVSEWPKVFESFMDYEPGGMHAGKKLDTENPFIFNPRAQQDKWVTPRSLHAASDIVQEMDKLDEHTLHAALAGTIGRAFAGQLMSYIRFGKDIPELGRVLQSPSTCPVPTNPTAQIVMAFKLITQTSDRDQAEAVVEYVLRMRAEIQTLFASNVSRTVEKARLFARVEAFGLKLLAENRKYFSA